jgi:hypothetical protein
MNFTASGLEDPNLSVVSTPMKLRAWNVNPSVEVVLRHFHRCRYRSSPLWFFCWRGTDRSGSWLSGNTVDTKIYVVRATGA